MPEAIDSVICGRCGHPAWDHCIGEEPCAECDSRGSWMPCKAFKLRGFIATAAGAFEEPVYQQ